MSNEKLFTVAGTATQNGVTKARFANDLVARIKILNKSGCTDINLIELPHAMTKLQALQHLQSVGITEGDAGYAVSAKLAEKAKVAKSAEVRVAVKPSAAALKSAASAKKESVKA
jgi:precorrin-3B methylase